MNPSTLVLQVVDTTARTVRTGLMIKTIDKEITTKNTRQPTLMRTIH